MTPKYNRLFFKKEDSLASFTIAFDDRQQTNIKAKPFNTTSSARLRIKKEEQKSGAKPGHDLLVIHAIYDGEWAHLLPKKRSKISSNNIEKLRENRVIDTKLKVGMG